MEATQTVTPINESLDKDLSQYYEDLVWPRMGKSLTVNLWFEMIPIVWEPLEKIFNERITTL